MTAYTASSIGVSTCATETVLEGDLTINDTHYRWFVDVLLQPDGTPTGRYTCALDDADGQTLWRCISPTHDAEFAYQALTSEALSRYTASREVDQ